MTRQELLPAVAEAVFALKTGGTSNVVETPVGFHLLKAEELREEKTKTLEEAREEVVETVKRERGRDEASRAAESDRQRVAAGADLSTVAKERKFSSKISRFFSRREIIPEVGADPRFYGAAFDLSAAELSPVVEGARVAYLMRLKERRETRVPSLESLRFRVEKMIKDEKTMKVAGQKGDELLGKLNEKKDIQELAAQQGLKLEETGFFERKRLEIPKVGILEGIQPLGIPLSPHQSVADRLYKGRDAVYVFALKETQEADMGNFDSEKEKLEKTVLGEKRQRAMQSFLEILKGKATIEVEAEALAQG